MCRPLSLYVHIPFCVKKCAYCDFLSFPAKESVREAYVNSLIRELEHFCGKVRNRPVVSVFFGGGTPSLLTESQMGRLMDIVKTHYSLCPDAEITLEANPCTVTADRLRAFHAAGINRLSLGMQSAHDRELKLLGRLHTYEQFLESYRLSRGAGFDNISVDLIYGLPEQTRSDWLDTVRKTAALEPEHISAYSLIIEEGTPFFQRYREDDLRRGRGDAPSVLPDEETERNMCHEAADFFQSRGYSQYEISNYARPGKESLHNTGYWIRRDYVGFGLGAASLLDQTRWKNTSRLEAYLQADMGTGCPGEELQRLTKEDVAEELMFLGLRMNRGVSKRQFQKEIGADVKTVYGAEIARLREQELLAETAEYVCLTPKGMDLANYCMAQFMR